MKRVLSCGLVLLLIAALSLTLPAAAEEANPNLFVLPSGLTKIGDQAFAGNILMQTVIVPNTVTQIGAEAFEGCTGLSEVTIAGREITISEDAFKNCSPDMVFYAHSDSDAMVWALAHGYACESLDGDSEHMARFSALLSHSGFDTSMLMSGTYASKCLIVRTQNGRLPDISAYHPIDIFKSEANLYYVQFDDEGVTEDCYNALHAAGLQVEPDRVGESDDISAQGVTIAENWGSNDVMGFDVYASFVAAKHPSVTVTIAVIDSGVSEGAWGGSFTDAASFVGGSAYTDSARHGSKVASIISDCLGSNTSRVKLMPIKIINNNSMYRTSVIIEGIKHAIKNNANIINMSFGWDEKEGTSPEIARQISNASSQGILIVGAAGNGSGSVMFPASLGDVMAVSALTYSSTSGYSVRSRTGGISYTAPGLHLSTTSYSPIDQAGDVIGSASTSFAAPQITAALTLIKLDPTHAANPVTALNSCCDDLGAEGLSSSAYGHGLPRLNRLAIIHTNNIALSNMSGDEIPSRLWLGDHDNDFMLTWEITPANATDKTVTVETSDASILSFKQYGNNTFALISAKGVGEAVISVTNDGITKQISIVVEQPVTQILLTGSDGMMFTGKTVQLAAAVLPENANNKAISWKSSNPEVATVTQSGLVSALKAGQSIITCEAQDGYGTSASINITVIDVPDAESITLSAVEKEIVDSEVTLEAGETLTLEATILPADAPQEVSYRSLKQSVATVSENGIVSAKAPGSTTIVATASTGRNVTEYLTVNVIISPASISVSADKTVLDIGETTSVYAELLPENTTETTVTWASSKTSVARVNKTTGVVTAVAPGTADITGTTVNGKKGSVTITVRQPITITFDANGGECGEPSRTAYSGYEIGALPSASRTYWKLIGWYTAKSGGTKVSATTVFTENTTLYAHWEGLPFTVTFDANGGNCGTETMTAKVGTKLGTLPVPTMDYYSFAGWFTAIENGTEVTADYVQNTTTNITVYALWTNNPYTMFFDANGGTCTTASKTGTVDTAIGVLPVPSRQGYDFEGWFTSDGNEVTETYVQSTTDSITVYAHWQALSYTMTFNANGGSCTTARKTGTVDKAIGTLPVPSREYYTFEGWFTVDGNKVTKTYVQSTADNITVYAHWQAMPYTMFFNANDGDCDESSRQVFVDTAVGELPTPVRPYHVFDGWYIDGESSIQVLPTYQQATTEDVTVNAHWTPLTYTVTFDANGGSCSTETMTGEVGCALGDLPTPIRDYFVFDGWYTALTNGTKVTESYTQSTNKDVTFYAMWTLINAESITLSAREKDITSMEVTLEVGETLTLLASVLPEEASQEVNYSSLKPRIVTVLENGVIKAMSPGTTTIVVTAAAGNNVNTYLTVNVIISPVSISVSADKTVLYIGETTSVTAELLPENTTETAVTWASSKTSVARVNKTTGVVTAVAPGTAIITGTTVNGLKGSVTITVPQPITITFDANGGECGEPSRTAYSGYEIGALPSASRTYWKLIGWYTAKSGGTKVSATTVLTENTTLYAHWDGLPYTVTFNANGGVCGTQTKTAKVGAKLGTLPVPTKDEYDFVGWYTAAAGGDRVTADYTQATTANLTLYAVWTANPYTVTLNANGGTCSTASITGTVDSPIGTLPVPVKPYYTFDGWFNAENEQITEDYVQTTATSFTAYAHWTPMTYTMTFNANGGTCNVSSRDYAVDTAIGEPPVPTRNYYTFTAWYTEGENSVNVTASYQQATTDDITVYARWSPLPYTVTFDPGDGSCSVETKIGYVDSPIGELPVPVLAYHVFEGWYKTDGTTKVDAAYTQSTNSAVTLVAHWTPTTYTMTFSPAPGTCSVESLTGTVGVAIGELPEPERAYYVFNGWFTAANGGIQITTAYLQNTDDDITVYAQWTPGQYTITLNANGGTCTPNTMTGLVDTPIGELPTPTRNYYTFNGWHKADSTAVDATYTQATTDNVTFYAHWTPMSYSMEFDPNGYGATTPVSRKDYLVDTPVNDLPAPERPYYTFAGWYTAASEGTQVTVEFTHPTTETIRVYAHWSPNPFQVTFNANGGECSTASKTCYVDTALGSLPTPTRSGCTFKGWYTNANGGIEVTASTVYNTTSSVTVYAHWESGWVLESAVPSGAKIIATSWSYRESTESTSSTMNGWTANGNYWNQTGTGSKQYASFPSTYDTSHSTYSDLNGSAYEAYENESTKREVSNAHAGYVYWHWAYSAVYNNNTSRWISDRKQWAGSSRNLEDYYYQYFFAFMSTTDASAFSGFSWTWGANAKYDSSKQTYNCANCLPSGADTSKNSGLNNPRFLRLDYYSSTYTDYQKIYKYYRDLSYQSSDPGNGSNISNKVKYVKWSNNQ